MRAGIGAVASVRRIARASHFRIHAPPPVRRVCPRCHRGFATTATAPTSTLDYRALYNQLLRSKRFRDLIALYFIHVDESTRHPALAVDSVSVSAVLTAMNATKDSRSAEVYQQCKRLNIPLTPPLYSLLLESCLCTNDSALALTLIGELTAAGMTASASDHGHVVRTLVNSRKLIEAVNYIRSSQQSLPSSVTQQCAAALIQHGQLNEALTLLQHTLAQQPSAPLPSESQPQHQSQSQERVLILRVFKAAVAANDYQLARLSFSLACQIDIDTPLHSHYIKDALTIAIANNESAFIHTITATALDRQIDIDDSSVLSLMDYYYHTNSKDSKPIIDLLSKLPLLSWTVELSPAHSSANQRANQRAYESQHRVMQQWLNTFGSHLSVVNDAKRHIQSVLLSQPSTFLIDLVLLPTAYHSSDKVFDVYESLISSLPSPFAPSHYTFRALLLSSLSLHNADFIQPSLAAIIDAENAVMDFALFALIVTSYLRLGNYQLLLALLNQCSQSLASISGAADFAIFASASKSWFTVYSTLVQAVEQSMSELGISEAERLELLALTGQIVQNASESEGKSLFQIIRSWFSRTKPSPTDEDSDGSDALIDFSVERGFHSWAVIAALNEASRETWKKQL